MKKPAPQTASTPGRKRWQLVYLATIANAVVTLLLLYAFSRYFPA